MITVDMFSKNIKPNILMFVKTSHKWMCVLLNNKTLNNIYKVHEHNVNIYQWNSNDQIYAQNDFFLLCSTISSLHTRALQRNHQLLWRWLDGFS